MSEQEKLENNTSVLDRDTVKAKVYPKKRILELVNAIEDKETRIYCALLYDLAARAGEITPYQHWKKRYVIKDGKPPIKTIAGNLLPKKKEASTHSFGINVDTIEIVKDDSLGNYVCFKQIPVFKTKKRGLTAIGFITPTDLLFKEIIDFVENAKDKARLSGKKTYLFEDSVKENKLGEDRGTGCRRAHKRIRGRAEKALKANEPGFKLHSLRASRITHAAEESGGDIVYVQSISRHRDMRNAYAYIKDRNFLEKARKYRRVI